MEKSNNQKSPDQLFKRALLSVVLHQKASSSFLQRELQISYNLAGQILDQLESVGIISEFTGSEPRMIYFKDTESLKKSLLKPITHQDISLRKKKNKSRSIFPPSNRI